MTERAFSKMLDRVKPPTTLVMSASRLLGAHPSELRKFAVSHKVLRIDRLLNSVIQHWCTKLCERTDQIEDSEQEH